MKHFMLGALGALLVLVAAAVIVPLYADYLTRSQSSAWVTRARTPTMAAIADAAKRNGTVLGSGVGIARPDLGPEPPAHVEITDDGTLVLHGGRDGQYMVWTPVLAEGEVTWRCRGGSRRDVPRECADDRD